VFALRPIFAPLYRHSGRWRSTGRWSGVPFSQGR